VKVLLIHLKGGATRFFIAAVKSSAIDVHRASDDWSETSALCPVSVFDVANPPERVGIEVCAELGPRQTDQLSRLLAHRAWTFNRWRQPAIHPAFGPCDEKRADR